MNVQDRVAVQLLDDARAARNRGHTSMLVTPGERLEALRFIASQDGDTVDVGPVPIMLRGVLLVECVPAVDLERAHTRIRRLREGPGRLMQSVLDSLPVGSPKRELLHRLLGTWVIWRDAEEHAS